MSALAKHAALRFQNDAFARGIGPAVTKLQEEGASLEATLEAVRRGLRGFPVSPRAGGWWPELCAAPKFDFRHALDAAYAGLVDPDAWKRWRAAEFDAMARSHA